MVVDQYKKAYEAIRYHDMYDVKKYIDKNFDLEKKHKIVNEKISNIKRRYTPLMYASYIGWCEPVKYILSLGAKVDTKDDHFETALMIATDQCHPHIVRLLLEHGANPNVFNLEGSCPLLKITSKNYFGINTNNKQQVTETLSILLKRSDIILNVSDDEGLSPLMYLSMLKNDPNEESHNPFLKRAIILINAGININMLSKNKCGKNNIFTNHSALYFAYESNNFDLFNLLLNNGANYHLMENGRSSSDGNYLSVYKMIKKDNIKKYVDLIDNYEFNKNLKSDLLSNKKASSLNRIKKM